MKPFLKEEKFCETCFTNSNGRLKLSEDGCLKYGHAAPLPSKVEYSHVAPLSSYREYGKEIS